MKTLKRDDFDQCEKVLLTQQALAAMLDVSIEFIRRLKKSDEFPKPVQILPGSTPRWKYDDIKKWLDSRQKV
jgi:predicted DNA-binding transcriptional regulator AlpA